MAEGERDETGEWLLPQARRPPTVAELEQRVDHALAVARSAESAALEIGAAAIDAAEQARRAAELAERASERAAAPPSPVANGGTGSAPAEPVVDERLQLFVDRADRVIGRLRAIGPVPERVG
ncbi:MAG: hypothetical protein U0R71_08260 [Solirubrobacterales bacterium]